jgi:hypothetical protein
VPIHYALNPDLLHVLPERASFLPYASFDPASVSPAPPASVSSRPLVFVHAPSHRGAKGTEHVLAAAAALKAEGLAFELRLIEHLDRQHALVAYRGCDVMIDQLLAGWYGGLGLEAMALGKPVIAYLREEDMGALSPDIRRELPVINASPGTLTEVMRRMITMPRGELHALGHSSRKFALNWHDPLRIAARTLGDYQKCASEQRTCSSISSLHSGHRLHPSTPPQFR